MQPGSCVLRGCSAPPAIPNWSPKLCQNGGISLLSSIRETKKSRVGGNGSHVVSWSKIPWWKRKCKMLHCHDAMASSSVNKVRGGFFPHFHAVTIKCHSNMWNWLFDLPGWILCEQSSWCERKWWTCSWLCSSLVSPFLVSVTLNYLCMAHASFSESLSNHCQGFSLLSRFAQFFLIPFLFAFCINTFSKWCAGMRKEKSQLWNRDT
jgi:hypothetical protein